MVIVLSSCRLLPLAAVCCGGSSPHCRSVSFLAEAAFRGLLTLTHPTPPGDLPRVCHVTHSKGLLPVPLVDASSVLGNVVNRARVRYTGRFVGNM